MGVPLDSRRKPDLDELLAAVHQRRAEWLASGRTFRAEKAAYREGMRRVAAELAEAERKSRPAVDDDLIRLRERTLVGEIGVLSVGWGQILASGLMLWSVAMVSGANMPFPSKPLVVVALIGIGIGIGLVMMSSVARTIAFYLAAISIGLVVFNVILSMTSDRPPRLTPILGRAVFTIIYLGTIIAVLDWKVTREACAEAERLHDVRWQTSSVFRLRVIGYVVLFVGLQFAYFMAGGFILAELSREG